MHFILILSLKIACERNRNSMIILRNPIVLLLLIRLISDTSALVSNSKINPDLLRTKEDCERFSRQTWYDIAKCNAYYNKHDQTMYLDREFNLSLLECVETMKVMLKHPTIFYRPMDTTNIRRLEVMDFERETINYADLIPLITYFVGPGANISEVSTSFEMLDNSWLAVRISEKERRTSYYDQRFFNDLNFLPRVLTPKKYLFLNGWHLKNMPESPVLHGNLFRVFNGLIIWVEPDHSHLISRKQAGKFLHGSDFPVFFDMQNSPEYLSADSIQLKFSRTTLLGLVHLLKWFR